MKIFFLFTFSTFLLSAFEQAAASAHYDKILTHSRIRARDQGQNVCALQQVMGTKKKYFSTCRNWYQGSICGKKAVQTGLGWHFQKGLSDQGVQTSIATVLGH